MTEMEHDGLPWCFRGYPFRCTHEEAMHFIDGEELDFLFALEEDCKNCPKRLEYEKHHPDFTL